MYEYKSDPDALARFERQRNWQVAGWSLLYAAAMYILSTNPQWHPEEIKREYQQDKFEQAVGEELLETSGIDDADPRIEAGPIQGLETTFLQTKNP